MGKIKDLTGRRFGKVTVIEKTNMRSSGGQVIWRCRCDCGNEVFKYSDTLRTGRLVSCGCTRGGKIKDLSGHIFGHLTVLGCSSRRTKEDFYWLCQCDCGNTKEILGKSLKNKKTTSCGCALKRAAQELVGKKFGRLLILELLEKTNRTGYRYRCQCDCGKIKTVNKRDLLRGTTVSCGCHARDQLIKRVATTPYRRAVTPSKYRIVGDKCYIQLFNSSKEAVIDAEDVDKVKERHWVISSSGYAASYTSYDFLLLHRTVMNRKAYKEDSVVIDHIDGNRLNNCKENLRVIDSVTNAANRPEGRLLFLKKLSKSLHKETLTEVSSALKELSDTLESSHNFYELSLSSIEDELEICSHIQATLQKIKTQLTSQTTAIVPVSSG